MPPRVACAQARRSRAKPEQPLAAGKTAQPAVRHRYAHTRCRAPAYRNDSTSTVASDAAVAVLGDEAVFKSVRSRLPEFQEKGYLLIERFASTDELAALKQRAQQHARADQEDGFSIFTTVAQGQRMSADHFLASADKASLFFEDAASGAAGDRPQELCVNKIGHALHNVDDVFRDFSYSSKVKGVYQALGFRRPLPVQSMYIFKQPQIGGEYVPHQDSAFIATDPYSCVGLWIALEDCGLSNGCLHVAPHSHRDGIAARFGRVGDGTVGWLGGPDAGPPAFDHLHFEPLEVEAGTAVLLHGSNVHASGPNHSSVSRHAYSLHVVEGAEGYQWLEDNWLQRREAPFEPLFNLDAPRAGVA